MWEHVGDARETFSSRLARDPQTPAESARLLSRPSAEDAWMSSEEWPFTSEGVLMVLRLPSKASGCRGLELQVEAFQGLIRRSCSTVAPMPSPPLQDESRAAGGGFEGDEGVTGGEGLTKACDEHCMHQHGTQEVKALQCRL